MLRFFLLGLLAVGAFGAAPKPNIIFVLVDDLGYGDLGVFYQNARGAGDPRDRPTFRTPQLDRMAAEGARLTRHYCGAPVCAPSRASLMLGVTQGHANVRDNQFDKALEHNHTLASVLKAAGYDTALVGKWGLQGPGTAEQQPGHPLRRGFDYFYGMLAHLSGHYHYPKEMGGRDNQGQPTGVHENESNVTDQLDKCYSTDLFTARAKKWIEDHHAQRPERPFFLYLAYIAPHARLLLPTGPYPREGVQWLGKPGHMINTATGEIDSWVHPDFAHATWDHDSDPSTPELGWPESAKRHATMIRRLDEAMADLLRTLARLGIDDDTMVVFTSDNGPHNEAGSGGRLAQDPQFFRSYGEMDGIKRDVTEGGMRVPAIVRWPRHVPGGRVLSSPSQFHDWMPTLAELAGVPAPARTDGVSLLPELTARGPCRPSTIYTEYFSPGKTPDYKDFVPAHRGKPRQNQQLVWLGNFKGLRVNALDPAAPFAIHDVVGDPQESRNLAGQPGIPAQEEFVAAALRMRRVDQAAKRPWDDHLIPALALAPGKPGLRWRAFGGQFPWVPDFAGLKEVASGITEVPQAALRARNQGGGVEFSGFLRVPADGEYRFLLTAHAGAFLRLHQVQVVDADFGHAPGDRVSGKVSLEKGLHPLLLGYRAGETGTPELSLHWSGPGMDEQAIPASAFSLGDDTSAGP